MAPVGLSRLQLPGVTLAAVDVTPDFYKVPYISTHLVDLGGTVVIVDPGPLQPACSILRELIEQTSPDRVVIYATHVHIDHAGSIGCLVEKLGGIVEAVYVHPRGLPHLADPSKLWRAAHSFLGWIAEGYGEPAPVPQELLVATSDGGEHRYGNVSIRVLHTPGHASHHQSVILETGDGIRILYPGDSAGMTHPAVDAVAPTTPPPFRYDLYMESLRRQMEAKPSIVAYTHVGFGELQLLERHTGQAKKWLEEATSLVREDEEPSPDDLLEAVARVDEDTRVFLEFARTSSPALLEALRHSALGFLDYALRGAPVRRKTT